MTQYLIFFNQQWVPDRPEEWFHERGVLARAVVADMQAAGVLVYAGGLEEDPEDGFHATEVNEEVIFQPGPFSHPGEFVGGLTIVDVQSEDAARHWAGEITRACGWPQEVRRFK